MIVQIIKIHTVIIGIHDTLHISQSLEQFLHRILTIHFLPPVFSPIYKSIKKPPYKKLTDRMMLLFLMLKKIVFFSNPQSANLNR
ncbi:MAG TPA: hypothetical protein DIT04_03205 [Dysgonomonas sp.]|nr:hypothetical protein [Dysgonomonas sp.]